MKFCPNCGKELPENVKFCPYCGYRIAQESDEIPEPSSRKMSKRITKSLNISDTFENSESETQSTEDITKARVRKKKQPEIKNIQDDTEEEGIERIGQYSIPNNAIAAYFILNFILLMGNSGSDEIMGIFIYTWIVLLIIFIRRNKEKPFNWLLNIFLTLQSVLVFATGMMSIEYFGGGGDSIGAVIQLGLLVLMFITILVMLYQGNRRRL
jgi:uncharacterized Zn finger protein (UPF0148 family)